MLRRKALQLPLALALAAAPFTVVVPSPDAVARTSTSGEVKFATIAGGYDLAHTIRHGDGSWDRYGAIRLSWGYNPSQLVSAMVNGEEHLLVETWASHPYIPTLNHYIRRADGTWDHRGTSSGGFTRSIAVTAVSGGLHLVRRTWHEGPGDVVEHSSWSAGGGWSTPTVVPVAATESLSIGAAGSGGELRVLLTNPAGTGFTYLVRQADGTWSPATSVPFPVAGVTATSVDVAQVGSELHAAVLGSDAQLYHSIRRANGSWDAFGNVGQEAGDLDTPRSVSITASQGALQVGVATQSGLRHTIRFANGGWQPFGDVNQEIGLASGYEVAIAGE